jgi:hypothetical protein
MLRWTGSMREHSGMAATEDGASCIGHWRTPKPAEGQRPGAAGGSDMLKPVAWMELVSPKIWKGARVS